MSEFKMNVQAYLDRIGIHEMPAPTEENLVRITRAHLEAVPFENLEVSWEGHIPSMEAEDLYHKIVEKRNGGWCFELNKAIYLLLQGLGYTCRMVPSRIVHLKPELRQVSHRATVVEIDGHLWLCDVGFGGAGPKGAIRVDTTEAQTVFGDTFRTVPDADPRYVGEYVVSRCDDGHWEPVLTFRDHAPWLDPDFTALSNYYACWDRSPFKNKPVLYRCTPNGWLSLTRNHLIRLADGQKQEEDLTEDQVQEVIRSEFELHYN